MAFTIEAKWFVPKILFNDVLIASHRIAYVYSAAYLICIENAMMLNIINTMYPDDTFTFLAFFLSFL